jgi:hypothetical protein
MFLQVMKLAEQEGPKSMGVQVTHLRLPVLVPWEGVRRRRKVEVLPKIVYRMATRNVRGILAAVTIASMIFV